MIKYLVWLLLFPFFSCYNNGVGRFPPMGVNTWCTDDICGLIDECTEDLVKSMADGLVETGMDKLGYKYVNMDDCWADKERNATGHMQPNPKRFPNGMRALADYIHSKGLFFGLYTCVGTHTCKHGRPGSFGHYDLDAKTFADWGMDFIKADNCAVPHGEDDKKLYMNFSRALNATGRTMVFSLCNWGDEDVVQWGHEAGQMFRIQMDHLPFWYLPTHAAGKGYGQGVIEIIEYMAYLGPSRYARPYGWMDPDFLETMFDPITMTFHESRTEYSLWTMWSAPLLVATDVRHPSKEKLSIVANPEVIAINRDPLSQAADRVANKSAIGGGQIWSRDLANGDKAVALLNAKDKQVTMGVFWKTIGWANSDCVKVRSLWERKDLGTFCSNFTVPVESHDTFLMRVTKAK